MEMLSLVLPVFLYVAGFILLIVLIILGIRCIQVLNKVEKVVDNVENKVNSFNNAFDVLTKATDTLAVVGDSVIGTIATIVSKIINKKIGKEDYYE